MKTQRYIKIKGFTLIEMSIVLVIIGLILGAMSIGKDMQRNAEYLKINASFIQGWAQAYQEYYDRYGVVVGDDTASPSLCVNDNCAVTTSGSEADGTELCFNGATADGLEDKMYEAGIEMPQGRANGLEDRYVYLDSNGNPQELQVCFRNVNWVVPLTSASTTNKAKNIMFIKGLTPDLAKSLDSSIDNVTDAQYGRFREQANSGISHVSNSAWSVDNRSAYGTTTGTNLDENQVAVVEAYYLMNQ